MSTRVGRGGRGDVCPLPLEPDAEGAAGETGTISPCTLGTEKTSAVGLMVLLVDDPL